MLTNLAYAGGGTNTYGDVKTLTQGDPAGSYTIPAYYISVGANTTTEPTNPSTSTSGTGQYGYSYSWCAAMGAQAGTSACLNATTPLPNTSISICPSGWRLPFASAASDFNVLNGAVNGGSTTSDTGLRTAWLGQYSGNGFTGIQGGSGHYWSLTQSSATNVNAFTFYSTGVTSPNSLVKYGGYAVRCLAAG